MGFGLWQWVAILLAYLIGSVSFSYLIAKKVAGIDIREHGSGNAGATNVMRVVGKKPGIIALLLDFLKGIVPLLLVIHLFFPGQYWLHLMVAIGLILGHCFSIFLNFRGGKAAITSLGCLFAMEPVMAAGMGLLVFGIFKLSRMVSLASIIASILTPVAMIVLQSPLPYTVYAFASGLLILFRHRANIVRLLQGTEGKL